MIGLFQLKNQQVNLRDEEGLTEFEALIQRIVEETTQKIEEITSDGGNYWIQGEIFIGVDPAYSASELERNCEDKSIIWRSKQPSEQYRKLRSGTKVQLPVYEESCFIRLRESQETFHEPLDYLPRLSKAICDLARVHLRKDYDRLAAFVLENEGNPGICHLDRLNVECRTLDLNRDHDETRKIILGLAAKGSLYICVNLYMGKEK